MDIMGIMDIVWDVTRIVSCVWIATLVYSVQMEVISLTRNVSPTVPLDILCQSLYYTQQFLIVPHH